MKRWMQELVSILCFVGIVIFAIPTFLFIFAILTIDANRNTMGGELMDLLTRMMRKIPV